MPLIEITEPAPPVWLNAHVSVALRVPPSLLQSVPSVKMPFTCHVADEPVVPKEDTLEAAKLPKSRIAEVERGGAGKVDRSGAQGGGRRDRREVATE